MVVHSDRPRHRLQRRLGLLPQLAVAHPLEQRARTRVLAVHRLHRQVEEDLRPPLPELGDHLRRLLLERQHGVGDRHAERHQRPEIVDVVPEVVDHQRDADAVERDRTGVAGSPPPAPPPECQARCDRQRRRRGSAGGGAGCAAARGASLGAVAGGSTLSRGPADDFMKRYRIPAPANRPRRNRKIPADLGPLERERRAIQTSEILEAGESRLSPDPPGFLQAALGSAVSLSCPSRRLTPRRRIRSSIGVSLSR